jgi:hypothetical protein
MDVYGVAATLKAVVDPAAGAALSGVLEAMTAPDPGARPSVDEALARLVRHTGRGRSRPWPRWADRGLVRDVRRRSPANVPA